jgi:hypothetical protein
LLKNEKSKLAEQTAAAEAAAKAKAATTPAPAARYESN